MSYELVGKNSAANRASAAVLVLVDHVLHIRSNEAVGTEQMTLQALISEESPLTLLTVQRGSVCEHFRMNSNLIKKTANK